MMTQPGILRLIAAKLFLLGLVLSAAAKADVDLYFGIYAADQRVKKMWQCGELISAIEQHMSDQLDETVMIEIEVDQNYDRGVEAVMSGVVDFARFPNIEKSWVIHPDVPAPVVSAWRDAYRAINFERLPYMVSDHVYVEGGNGYCRALQQMAASRQQQS